jgi:1-acyl-sn-glycerol-3-phosphate acyltransferase
VSSQPPLPPGQGSEQKSRSFPEINKRWYYTFKNIVSVGFFGPLGGLRVLNADRVPQSGPLLVAPVHVSYLDPMVMGCTSPRLIRFMAKKELFKNPLLGGLIGSVGAFAVERGASDTSAIRLAIDILRRGEALMMFPEGTRGDSKTFGEIKPGIAMLAKKSGAKVQPVGIHGTNLILPRGGKGLRRQKITVSYGRPLCYDEIEAQGDPATARERFTQAVVDGLDEACREAGLILERWKPEAP